jgi:hypothetical protein
MILLAVAVAVFLLNIPFGYWRETTRRFSLQWAISIHLPVPMVIALRHFSGLGWEYHTYPFLVAAFFLGQYAGVLLQRHVAVKMNLPASGCLVMDIYRQAVKSEKF